MSRTVRGNVGVNYTKLLPLICPNVTQVVLFTMLNYEDENVYLFLNLLNKQILFFKQKVNIFYILNIMGGLLFTMLNYETKYSKIPLRAS